jgi:anaerobic selenocysteine-containing dehydrogenase
MLAKRMGFDDPCFDDSEERMIEALLSSGPPNLNGITLDRLDREKSIRLNVSDPGTPYLPFANGGFGTPSGKCELWADNLEYTPPAESRFGSEELRSRYPLELIPSKNDDSMNSTFGYREDTDFQTATLAISPEDAEPRGIASGDLVRVFNDRGSVQMLASVNGVTGKGVVRAPSVRWNKKSPGRTGINVLTSDRLTDFGGGPTFYACLVQVEKCGD